MNKSKTSVSYVEVSPQRHGQRLDNFLAAQLKGVPRSVIYRVIRTGQVRVNGHRAKPSRRLEAGDSVRIPPASIRAQDATDIPAKAVQLLGQSICYEDDDVMVIDKPAGMAVHGGSNIRWGVVDVVRKLRPNQHVDLVHRLDRETSGCLLLALNGEALRELNRQLAANLIDKRYLCLLDGHLRQAVVEVHAPLSKSERSGERFMRVDPAGKKAHTTFRLLQNYGPCSFAQAQLHSGRTHQIRVHALELGMALVGDRRYAPTARQKFWNGKSVRRLFLHAQQLCFHTLTGQERLVSAPLPEELSQLIDSLE